MSLVYEIRPGEDRRGVNLISHRLRYGALWYGEPNAVENTASYAVFNAGSEPAEVRILDPGGMLVETRTYTPKQGQDLNTIGRL
jgi:hypothetical protein